MIWVTAKTGIIQLEKGDDSPGPSAPTSGVGYGGLYLELSLFHARLLLRKRLKGGRLARHMSRISDHST